MSAVPSFARRAVVAAATLLALAVPPGARAAGDDAPDAGFAALAAARREAAELSAALGECRASTRSLDARASTCAGKLGERETQLFACRAGASACQEEKRAACNEDEAMVQSVLLGDAPPVGTASCVPAAHQRALGTLVSGWRRAGDELEGLREYEAGGSDRLPRVSREAARTQAERIAAQVLGGPDGRRRLWRRLLVEALRRIAPDFWRRLAARGEAPIDGWFASPRPLDRDLVRAAESEPGVVPAGEPPPLVSALDLVESYLTLSDCAGRPRLLGECRRARELRDLLEQSGPLVLEGRERAVWAADCRDVNPAVVAGWLEPFPAGDQTPAETGWRRIATAAYGKLLTCWLADPSIPIPFSTWLDSRLPARPAASEEAVAHAAQIEALWTDGGADDLCLRAARALQRLPEPRSCALPAETLAAVSAWASIRSRPQEPAVLRACGAAVQLLWSGDAVRVTALFDRPPAAEEIVTRAPTATPTPMGRLRALCADRQGPAASFSASVVALATVARLFGEAPEALPWRLDARADASFEDGAVARRARRSAWLGHLLTGNSPCGALGLAADRCAACAKAGPGRYDCRAARRLAELWTRWTRQLELGLLGLAAAAGAALWLAGLARALRGAMPWAAQVRALLGDLGLPARPDRWRFLLPSRFSQLTVALPEGPAWERWGRRASVLRASALTERTVDEAAVTALRSGSEVALLVHPEGAVPELPAVRSMLEWSAKGGRRAVQLLPVSRERLQWAHAPGDLLDLVEQTSLRGNPFQVRGRIHSSSQFFDRERLVSGLLAGVGQGDWTLVTGLRRMGKSSLALEVARRLHGPAAYVDLAGFHHELTTEGAADRAAEAILRYACVRLLASARETWPGLFGAPALPPEAAPLDAGRLTEWLGGFARACRDASGGRPGAALLVLDEIEQGLSGPPRDVRRALEAFEIVVGRLRAALGELGSGADLRVGVVLCSALHPLLWAPLATLTGQSIIGAFPWACVPALPVDAAEAMMRSLGAWHGVRFRPEALALIVREGGGVPLLVRRLGSAILELYDPERARQGSLGAVEIGIEGARAAVRREAGEGSPTRVWVESEIGDGRSPVGRALRLAARGGEIATAELSGLVAELSFARFGEVGLDALLSQDEQRRRAEEAGGVTVQILQETGVLDPVGDLTAPEKLSFPDGLLRRILAEAGMSAVA